MPIYGSFAETAQRHLNVIPTMMEETARESGESIEAFVKEGTPVQTGELFNSIESGAVGRDARGRWKVSVESSVDHAAAIEFGAGPHRISANEAQALQLANGEFYDNVMHPGNEGFHMFRRGAISFERVSARRIAISNAKQFLGTT
jgi:hypothetical protein